MNIVKQLINIINHNIENVDEVIYNFLDELTENGKDELIVREIKSWVNEH